MTPRPPLDPTESTWLREGVPPDSEGRRAPWAVRHRSVTGERWSGRLEHEALTLDDIVFNHFQWSGATLRGCVLRGVSLRQTMLSGMHFEDVAFDGCSLEDVRLDGCTFVRCRFIGGSAVGWRAHQSTWRGCDFEGLRGEAWTLVESTLDTCSFRECTLLLLRPSTCSLQRVEWAGGALEGAELSLCRAGALRLEGTALSGVRVLGGEIQALTLVGLEAREVSMSAVDTGVLSLTRCPKLSAVRVAGGRVGALRIQACALVEGLLLVECALGDLEVSSSSMRHTSFEGVTSSGPSRFEGSALAGLFFHEGAWADVTLQGALLEDYIAVEDVQFARFDPAGVRESPGVRYRIERVSYGEGSMTWGASRGT